MKRLTLAGLFAIVLASPVLGQQSTSFNCSATAFKHITTATDTILVPAIPGQTVYVCDYAISFNGTGNMYLESRTPTGVLTQIDMIWYGIANAGKAKGVAWYSGLSAGQNNGLSVNTSQAVSIDVSINYSQY